MAAEQAAQDYTSEQDWKPFVVHFGFLMARRQKGQEGGAQLGGHASVWVTGGSLEPLHSRGDGEERGLGEI